MSSESVHCRAPLLSYVGWVTTGSAASSQIYCRISSGKVGIVRRKGEKSFQLRYYGNVSRTVTKLGVDVFYRGTWGLLAACLSMVP
jgi:hypothetical protein